MIRRQRDSKLRKSLMDVAHEYYTKIRKNGSMILVVNNRTI